MYIRLFYEIVISKFQQNHHNSIVFSKALKIIDTQNQKPILEYYYSSNL